MCYLWDNFIGLYDADEIFLLGVGNAYLGVKVLLINRGLFCGDSHPICEANP